MSVKVSPKGAGRLRPVTLRDVPLETRRAAARPLLDAAARRGGWQGVLEAALLTRAVHRPSGRVYLVSEAAAKAAESDWTRDH